MLQLSDFKRTSTAHLLIQNEEETPYTTFSPRVKDASASQGDGGQVKGILIVLKALVAAS